MSKIIKQWKDIEKLGTKKNQNESFFFSLHKGNSQVKKQNIITEYKRFPF